MNYGNSNDGALTAVSPSGDIYSAFRNGGIWQNGKISASKDDLPNIFTNKVTGADTTSDHVETIKNLWNSFPEQQVFACNVSDANNFAVFGFLYNSRKHGAILYISFNSCGVVKCVNGTFSNITL